jgi:histidinol-phosphatase (PHP family)
LLFDKALAIWYQGTKPHEDNMLYDNHVHIVPFSNDARQSVSDLLDHADKIGLSGVMTADHYEKDLFYAGGREDIFNITEYFGALRQVQNDRPANACRLLIGAELGYLPHLSGHLADVTASWPFDGVILSLHILDGEDPYIDTIMFRRDKNELYARYCEVMLEMMTACPDFDVLGHFDYISRYGRYPDRKMRYAELSGHFDELFRILISSGKTLEINTRSVARFMTEGYQGADAWPDADIIRRYLEMGGKAISLGSDGHLASEPGRLFQEGIAWLKSMGCRYLVHYENRKAIYDPLDESSGEMITPPAMISPSR